MRMVRFCNTILFSAINKSHLADHFLFLDSFCFVVGAVMAMWQTRRKERQHADPTRRLGTYMRAIASQLREEVPMEATEAGTYISEGESYAAMTLIKLAERGVAWQIGRGQFVRGVRWKESAAYYGWLK